MADFEARDIDNMDLLICSSEEKLTKKSEKYRELKLKNSIDGIEFVVKIWPDTLRNISDKTIFRKGNIVKVFNSEYSRQYGSYTIKGLELIRKGKIGLEDDEIEKLYQAILKYIELIEDEKLKEFVFSLVQEHAEKFKKNPAAKAHHHDYIGGLLQHTYECLKIGDDLLKVYLNVPSVSKGEVYAACILHDFGKLWEYEIDLENGEISYNDEFPAKWVNHSLWAFTQCMSRGFEKVAKMIAAHHARSEWGAVIDLNTKDLEPFCYLLHHIDDLSAKFGKITVNDKKECRLN
ncbi:MAG: TraI domain-containing protein [Alphaproteobacteria bacterium]|nr:TraI domain-containing protein [Alphaproteobacteria bacterium]MCR4624112.1 TraI domain-containing protein [Alphaproteobacteria bacterium]